MNSIRTKITLLTVCAIVAAMVLSTLISVVALKDFGDESSSQMLYLLCETGEIILDSYFESVEQSVEMVSGFAQSDLKGLDPARLRGHILRVRDVFGRAAYRTNGILTYYYRIDPEVSKTEKGFWYIKEDSGTFQEHEVTDIALYDTEDTTKLVWFTVPKATGQPIWLSPYVTDNLDVRVISYNVPIYWNGTFVGVAGIEMDYSTMAEQVDSLKLYENGYAFISDEEGRLIYHPYIDVPEMTGETRLTVPGGLPSDSNFFHYTYDDVKKLAVWLPLNNGMRLIASVPVSEINSGWLRMISMNAIVSIFLLAVFIGLTLEFADRITAPLRGLTEAAKQLNKGNYDIEVDYHGKDEVGILAHTFRQLTGYLKVYIGDLSDRAFADALTSVHNKGAFDIYVREMEAKLEKFPESANSPHFAVCVFDCDNLKQVNDQYGHDKGDIYLKNASAMICRVFQHSPVFRTGGDEFTAILRNDDYRDREKLIRRFEERCAETCSAGEVRWEQVRVSVGIAAFHAGDDHSVGDVIRRADKMMYENKRLRKAGRNQE